MTHKEDVYPKEWHHLPSVTEVLDRFNEEDLVNWFQATPYYEIKRVQRNSQMIGTAANELIDAFELGQKKEISVPEDIADNINSSVARYMEWRSSKKWRFIKSQAIVISKSHGYIGQIDRLEKIENGGLVIIDWKTSKKLRFAHRLQLIAYKRAYEEMHGEKISESYLIRLDKKGKTFNPENDVHQIKDDGRLFTAFLNLLNFYKVYEEEKENGL